MAVPRSCSSSAASSKQTLRPGRPNLKTLVRTNDSLPNVGGGWKESSTTTMDFDFLLHIDLIYCYYTYIPTILKFYFTYALLDIECKMSTCYKQMLDIFDHLAGKEISPIRNNYLAGRILPFWRKKQNTKMNLALCVHRFQVIVYTMCC